MDPQRVRERGLSRRAYCRGRAGLERGLLGNVGNAVSVLALLLLAVVPIVWWVLPETRDVSLDVGG